MDNQWSWIFIYGCFVVALFRISYFEVASASQVYSLCDDPDSHLVKILSLDLEPNPIVVPGSINFGMAVNITEDIEGPISVDVSITERRNDGSLRPIPCRYFGIQECHYDDICSHIGPTAHSPCPSYVTTADSSCSCPFQAGVYSFGNLTRDLFFLTSEQELLITFNVTTPNSTVSCIEYDVFLAPFSYAT